ncbi:MAG: glycosyltransferase [Acidiphilium sp.]|nr:glycosyltransferase [Acidiphilium sp.]MDD4936121.1 glycosyltransferase [Acidiphilium sp.]
MLPTFVSAIQARRHTAVASADIAIYSFGETSSAARAFDHACQTEGIRFFSVRAEEIGGASAMLARLFLTRFVPSEYKQFLYIDGDTQITESLDPLVDYPVPPGQFLAATDPMTFAILGRTKHDRDISEYFSSIGIPAGAENNYFNTGVLRINREGWEELGLGAWNLFRKHERRSRFPDQDALNIVGGANRIPMSLAWNFPIFMRNSRVETIIKPRIYHFMGSPKPWHGVFLPWGASVYQPYVEAVKKYPDLAAYLSVMPLQKKLRYMLQQHYKQGLETVTWGFSERRNRILNYENSLTRA